ncbi:MAG TPA: c-type cytochrome [Acidimicrobiales bacterium]|nr:c-type cytochrome [Acidimicrobiales bacterium]
MRRRLLPVLVVTSALAVGLLVLFPHGGAGSAPGDAVLTAASTTDTSAQLAHGKQLFDETCSTCHGVNAGGGVLAPNLRGLGAGTVDLWVSSGWMPLATPTQEPIRKPAKFDRADTLAIANYVASLTPNLPGVPVPQPDLKNADLAEGFSLFTLNCAPCHTITGAGDALSNGLSAPPLHGLTTTEIQEAIETGPSTMPRFIPGALTPAELSDVVAYVHNDIEHPANPGGIGLGGVGPVAEGFIGLFLGVGLCLLIAMWIGDRTDEDESEHEGHPGEPTTEGAHA